MPNDGIYAALAAYRKRRKELARRFLPVRCPVCFDEVAPGDPLGLYNGHGYCSVHCAAYACGVSYVEDGDDGYLEQFAERSADDLEALAARENLH